MVRMALGGQFFGRLFRPNLITVVSFQPTESVRLHGGHGPLSAQHGRAFRDSDLVSQRGGPISAASSSSSSWQTHFQEWEGSQIGQRRILNTNSLLRLINGEEPF